jgi:ArsR family transcriptional regulator, arsenate/arsenite/antimonite-responsive transcriptional repressor
METTTAVTALAALAQETRLAIYRLLVEAGPAGVAAGTIASKLGVAAPTLSFHLKELAYAGLVRGESQGRFVVYRADYDAMNALLAYLTENCCRSGECTVAGDAVVCVPVPIPANRVARTAQRSAKSRRVR